MAEPPRENIPMTAVGHATNNSSEVPAQNLQLAGGPTEPQAGLSGNGHAAPSPPIEGNERPPVTPQTQMASTGAVATPAALGDQVPTTVQPPTTNISPGPNPQASPSPIVNGNTTNDVPVQQNGGTSGPSPSPQNLPGKKTFIDFCWSMKGPIFLMVVYAITTYILITATDINGPLARSGVTGGFLLLNVLALLNNYALLAAGDKAWQSAQWSRRFMQRGQNLTDFLALSNSSGVAGWVRIVCHDLRPLKRIRQRLPRKLQQMVTGFANLFGRRRQVARAGTTIVTQTRRPSITKARFWGLSRVGFWLLIQFPGLIFMTKVNAGIDYRPTNWEDISGGIGKYNPSEAALRLSNGAYLSSLALNMIRDNTITKDWPAISPECKTKTNCASYIIPGGLKTVAPWRYLAENGSSLPMYMTRDTPVYQLDFWDGPAIVQWAEKDCTLFGMYGTTGIADIAFLICMTPYEDGKILAGESPLQNVENVCQD
ncbi:hypothetical protein BKA64DRAFT_202299 [Cadophora sp. MPI-SDFR-AT-0126]|nr:hypothetical protein BKA64DRAFT_202299 [Leotiomycetes sp. MPI-SDFR-AT-0126]